MRFKLRIIHIRLILAFLFSQFAIAVWAQPQANFTTNKTGGCSPLFISFTNTTTGASANAVYQWSFGNGNTSTLQNPGAVFYEEKTYTITLTVIDGVHTSVKTKTITVYKRPTVDFDFSPGQGCLPVTVNFASTTTPGDGEITVYQWDFGDGATQQALVPSVPHTYTFTQSASVSLTVLDERGCTNTITKSDIIKVSPAIHAEFVADKTLLCEASASVSFTNSSNGPGTLSYEWDFGDGNTSMEKNPVHTYTQNETYTVKLTVRSSEGCTHTMTRTAYINVGDFHTDFTVPSLLCTGGTVSFNNISSPVPGQCNWVFDGLVTINTSGNSPVSYSFANPGQHTISLTSRYGACQETITKTVDVKSTPVLQGFLADITSLCGSPVTVNFQDTAQGATSWQWNFDWYANNSSIHSTVQNPSHTYDADNDYYVSLTVANADGCKANVRKSVHINKPLVGIFLDPPGSMNEGCGQLTTKFIAKSTEEIISYAWDFGDGTPISNLPEPVHTFSMIGTYIVSLTYTTINGCTGTVFYHGIKVHEPAVANFTFPDPICGNSAALFTNTSTGYLVSFLWNFGDNTGIVANNQPTHNYQDQGDYVVTLIAYNGLCNDTISKTVKVIPPFPRIGNVVKSCDGTRGTVQFQDLSKLTNSWHWNFGDGHTTSYTTPQNLTTHTYTNTGNYWVVLTNTNGPCTVKDSVFVHVLLKQNPALTAHTSEVCLENASLNIQVANLERFLIPDPLIPPNYIYKIVKGDGTDFQPAITVTSPDLDALPWQAALTNFTAGDHQLRVVARSTYFSCYDTSNAITIRIKGPDARFTIPNDTVCFKSPVLFQDVSVPGFGVPIVKWEWDFGDGIKETYTQGGNVYHRYANPSQYFVKLKVTDADGCTMSYPKYNGIENRIVVSGPKAAFILTAPNNPSAIPLNTAVGFNNNTDGYGANGVSFLWNFGNGNTSTDYYPTHTFTIPGNHEVILTAVGLQGQCRDTARMTIIVGNFNTGFTTSTLMVGDYNRCPPVLARFTNTSVNYTRLVWDFGDGTILEDQPSPSHVYTSPGTYFVTLTAYGFNGLTAVYRDTIFVSKPQATIQADDVEGCIGHQVTMHAPVHNNAATWLWDLGNGHIKNPADSFVTHQYMQAGSYAPSVYITDANGCSVSVPLSEKIIIHPDPIITVAPAAPIACKANAVQLQASGAATYQWSPAAGLSDAAVASPLALPANTTTYTVNATDAHGCINDASITVTVPKPFALNGPTQLGVCKSSSIQLNMTGANSYEWINTTTGLSSTQIGNPIASPLNNTIYTIVGHDEYHCYSDTVQVDVKVLALPSVQAGADLIVAYGAPTQLSSTTSSDVVRWSWTPSDYLNCTNCPSPVSRPQSEIDYIVTVYNSNNCEAKDTVNLKMICAEGNIHIPNAFTPNRDGKNDVFTINGHGVRMIKFLRIYNRWGEVVFERKNFFPNDNASAWNGRFKGVEAPAGAYVYFIEMECSAGQTFVRKGTVTLLR